MEISTTGAGVLAERLGDAIARTGLTKRAFAELAGIDRTTLSQLLSKTNRRLPRADTLHQIAVAHQLSIDWLLGLSNAGPLEAELLTQTSFEAPGPSPSDERLLGWLSEAADYKIRYVPATLPDLLKSEGVIRFERSGIGRSQRCPDDRHHGCPLGVGPPSGHGAGVLLIDSGRAGVRSRRGPVEPPRGGRQDGATRSHDRPHRRALPDISLVPVRRVGAVRGTRHRLRIQRAALYLGGLYLVLTSAEQVRALSRHFDGVVRDATVQPTSMPRYLTRLRRHVR